MHRREDVALGWARVRAVLRFRTFAALVFTLFASGALLPLAPALAQSLPRGTDAGQDGVQTGGQSPTIVFSDPGPSPQVGREINLRISLVNLPESDLNMPMGARIVATNAVMRLVDGREGSDLGIEATIATFLELVRAVSVTPSVPGPVTMSVSAWPAGRVEEAINSVLAFDAVEAPMAVEPGRERGESSTTGGTDLATYQPLGDAREVANLATTAVVVLFTAGAAAGASMGASSAARGDASSGRDEREVGTLEEVKVSFSGLAAARVSDGRGDRFAYWRLRGSTFIDGLGHALVPPLARVSPVLARLTADATYARALFGVTALILPTAGALLGVQMARHPDEIATTPSLLMLCLLAALGTLDALAGAVAATTFAVGVALSGGLTSFDDVRALMGVGLIGFGPALIAGAFRPFRRDRGASDGWERLTDFVVLPLFGAFVVHGMVGALPGLSGSSLTLAESGHVVALVVAMGLLVRTTLEEIAGSAFPERIRAVAVRSVPQPHILQQIGSAMVRASVFTFVTVAFLGNVWQLWVGTAVFGAGLLVEIVKDRLPNSPTISRLLPRGVPRVVVLLVFSAVLSALAGAWFTDESNRSKMTFLLLTAPGLALTCMGALGRVAPDGRAGWWARSAGSIGYRVGGVLMLLAAIALVLVR